MKFLLLIFSALFLSACAGAKHANIDNVFTEDDFAKAKIQIYKNFHKCYQVDAPWAEDSRVCAQYLSQDMQLLMHKLEDTHKNVTIANMEETRLTMLLLSYLFNDANLIHMLLFTMQNVDSVEANMNGVPEIGAKSIYEEKVLAQSIYYESTVSYISMQNISREDKEALWLYMKFLITKYGFNQKNIEMKHLFMKNKHQKQAWLKEEIQTFCTKYPNSQYKKFFDTLSFL